MVAKITTPGSINRALNYNEKKVQKGAAQCLHAGNYLKDAMDLNFYEKLCRFERLNTLNCRAKTNTLHISLNFDPSELLEREKLIRIASAYMQRIGFGDQPYLVYQHLDAGHPHLHIVTTSIQEDGRRINTYNIGRNQSEQARKAIEECFGLIKAAGKKEAQIKCEPSPLIRKVTYGFAETKRSITSVLEGVLNRYHYTSLPELNAILKAFRVLADRGKEGGRMYCNKGLTYRVLDDKGDPIGVPIKASSIYFKPTLAYLEQQFQKGHVQRAPHLQKLKTAIDWTLHNHPGNMLQFVQRLKAEGVHVELRRSKEGYVYGITFIDFRTRCVFNGSDLGKRYSAAAIQQRLLKEADREENTLHPLLEKSTPVTQGLEKIPRSQTPKEATSDRRKDPSPTDALKAGAMLEALLKEEKGDVRLPYDLLKKKQKRRGLNL